jgi:hypothetical protein
VRFKANKARFPTLPHDWVTMRITSVRDIFTPPSQGLTSPHSRTERQMVTKLELREWLMY